LFLVSVSGACSRAGKTAVAVSLLEALPPKAATAVKLTTTEDVFERCPRGTSCAICDIPAAFRIVEDGRILDEPGTDTARLGAAGASRVIWTIAKRSALRSAWEATRARAEAGEGAGSGVVMEGSTIVELARPDLHIFVVHPFLDPERWKPTSGPLIGQADLVVINRPATERRAPRPSVMAEVRRHRPRDLVVTDVTRPLREWAPQLVRRLWELRRGDGPTAALAARIASTAP
jgi:hypothetical protein